MKIFFSTTGTETGTSAPEATKPVEATKTTEQILTSEIKLDKFYVTAYEKFIKEGGKKEELIDFVKDITSGKIDGLKIENGQIKSENLDGTWSILGIDKDNKINSSFDFKEAISISKDQIQETNNAEDDKKFELELETATTKNDFDKISSMLKGAFKNNDFDKIGQILKLDTKNQSNNISVMKKLHDDLGDAIKEKIPNLKNQDFFNSLNWTFTLFVADGIKKSTDKTKQNKLTTLSVQNNTISNNLDDMFDLINKGIENKTLDINSLIFSNPLLSAKKLEDVGNIMDGKIKLTPDQFKVFAQKDSSIKPAADEQFKDLQTRFKSAIELSSAPQSTVKMLTGAMSSLTSAKTDFWNSSDGKNLKDSPEFKTIIDFLVGTPPKSDSIFTFLFKLLGVLDNTPSSAEAGVDNQKYSDNILTFVKSLSKKDDLKENNSQKLGKILGVDEKTDISNITLKKTTDNKDQLLSAESFNIIKSLYPEAGDKDKSLDSIKGILSDSTKLQTTINGKILKFNDFYAKYILATTTNNKVEFDDKKTVDNIPAKQGLIKFENGTAKYLDLESLDKSILTFNAISAQTILTQNKTKSLTDIYALLPKILPNASTTGTNTQSSTPVDATKQTSTPTAAQAAPNATAPAATGTTSSTTQAKSS